MQPIPSASAVRTRSNTTWASIVIATFGCLVFLPCLPARAETRVAVIGSQAAAVEKLVPLVELRLGQQKELVLLEREKIQEVLREQELGALTTAEGAGKRVALGKLLKADVLILLQGEAKPQPHVRVMICETKQGLRLCNQPVELSKSIEADADAVLRLAEKAIDKQRKPIDDIVAVPPFVNNTLAYEGDHLKAACAKLIEEMLLDRPGVLVVELAEAKAISQELALVNEAAVKRRLPLYLMGEYRLDGKGERQTVSCTLQLLRGTGQLDQRQLDGGAVADLPRLACQAAAEMFSKSLGQAVKPPDAETEGKQLAERAKLAMRLGDWQEALTLAEAALLVNPELTELHGDAIECLNAILVPHVNREYSENHANYVPDSPAHRLAKAMLPTNLYHLERFMRDTPLNRKQTNYMGWLPGICCGRILWNVRWQTREEFERGMADFEPVMAMARRVLAAKAEAKVQDETLWLLYRYADVPLRGPMGMATVASDWREQYLREHFEELRDRRIELLQKFAFLKVRHNCSPGGGLDDMVDDIDAACLAFLRRAARIPCVQRDAEERIRWAMQVRLNDAYRKAHPAGEPDRTASSRRTPAAAPAKAPEVVNPEVAFHPIPFCVGNQAKSPLVLRNCLSTVDGIDLLVGNEILYLMKDKDELRPLPVQRKRKRDARDIERAPDVCFDGQFIWLLSPDPDRYLAVIDPRTERVWKYAAKDGLPPMGQENGAAVTPLAPGKICAAGFFGRRWCGVATFSPEKGISLNVFFEARDKQETRAWEDRNPNIALPVGCMLTFNVPPGREHAGEQRVLLFAGRHHCVMLDPENRVKVEVFDVPSNMGLFCLDDGAVYWGEEGGQPCRLYRHAYPDFKEEKVQPDGRFGPIARYNGQIYMWNYQLCVSPSLREPFRTLRGTAPEESRRHMFPVYWRSSLAVSHHYGLVLLAPPGAYRIEFLKPQTTEP